MPLPLLLWSTAAAAMSLSSESTWEPYPGILIREQRWASPSNDVWVAEIDLCEPGIQVVATEESGSLRTAGTWGSSAGVQLAVNGDFYRSDIVRVYGDAVGGGAVWSTTRTGAGSEYSWEWYYRDYGWLAFGEGLVELMHTRAVKEDAAWGVSTGWVPEEYSNTLPAGVEALVSGFPELVVDGVQVTCSSPTSSDCFTDRSDMRDRHPRTAMGLSEDGETFYLVVVDGRSSRSSGMYGTELAELMFETGAWFAINLDGGGSTQMWLSGTGYLNSPSDGSARSVANHWGIKATGSGEARHCGAFDRDDDGWTVSAGDCDDDDPARHPGAVELCDGVDQDCDEEVDEGFDLDGDGYRTCDGDCDDGAAEVHPGAVEVEDGIDQDCDFEVDDGTAAFDDDHDGWTEHGGDCDDGDAFTFPGAPELPDGGDDDCDGQVDEGTVAADDDGDGFSEREGDCDDADPAVFPGGEEVAGGRDEDCDGAVDEGTAAADDDGDGWSEAAGDCDDTDRLRYPGAPERADGVDQDCDGQVDEGTAAADDDGDGWTEAAGDCHDGDPAVFPGAPEVVDGRDQDCDGLSDEGTAAWDDDGDGWTEAAGDCDDLRASTWPGAPELHDGRDNDCDGVSDEGTVTFDDDGDGWAEDHGDCDDGDAAVHPGAEEVEDGRDNDCDGLSDEHLDRDGDGWTAAAGDCDDADPAAFPGADEPLGAGDLDCDGVVVSPRGWGAGCQVASGGGLLLLLPGLWLRRR